MRLVYLTSKNYPAATADHVYVLELARGFFEVLGKDFLLVVNRNASPDLNNLPLKEARGPASRFRTIYYFFWLPIFALARGYRGTDAVFFSNDPNLLLALVFWRTIFGFRIVSDWHLLLGDWRDRVIAQKSDALVSTSQKLKNTLVKKFDIAEKKILVAYGGIDLARYPRIERDTARKDLDLPGHTYIVSYIGFFKTLGMEKGVGTMIESLPLLPQNVAMLFVGGNEKELEEYGSRAASLGVRDRCIFVAKKKPEELPPYEQASDLLSIPYPDLPHFRNYGFPMKVYEYMASGRPIVYSKLELVEEVISDCAFGFMPGDSRDFARAVTEAMSNPDTSKTYADRASARVQEYTWAKKARQIADFLEIAGFRARNTNVLSTKP